MSLRVLGQAQAALGQLAEARESFETSLACLAEDVVFENTTPAPDGQRMVGPAVGAFFEQFLVSTPSARFTTEEAFAAGDRAASGSACTDSFSPSVIIYGAGQQPRMKCWARSGAEGWRLGPCPAS